MAEEHRRCKKCLVEKPLTEYRKYKTAMGNISKRWVCQTCHNKQFDPKQKARTARETSRRNKQTAIELFGGKCQKCGGVFHPVCFEFHHIDETQKKRNPSHLLKYNFEYAMDELSNCMLVCSNCHKLIHFEYKMGVNNA